MPIDFAKRIKELRVERGLSQERVASELKITRPTYAGIENGTRDLKINEMERLAEVFGITRTQLEGREKTPRYPVRLEQEPAQKPIKEFRINVPQKNLMKFREVLLYVLEKVGALPQVGETVIYKLLYFIDFDYYEKYEEQLIGASYIKNKHGPTPIEFKKIVDKMIKSREITPIRSKYFQFDQKKYLPLRPPNLSLISGQEIAHVAEVLARLSGKNATELSEYSHQDVPWLTAKMGDPIEYESVFYRTPTTSVRNYED